MWNGFLNNPFNFITFTHIFRDQSPRSPSWQYFCYNPLFKSNPGGSNCPEGIRLNSGTPSAPIPRPIWLWVQSDMAPIFLCLELPLFLSASSNFHQHHHNWNSKCLKHHKIQMTHPNVHVKLSALKLLVWEANSRQSQLTCCHTQHCHLWTDIMICTIIPHATIFSFYTTSKTNIINEFISSFI